jgi:hypothetical protein
MNLMTVLVGAAAIAFSLFTLIARVKKPRLFRKLQPMKDHWGPRAGVAIHVVAYTIVPLVFGVVTVLSGLAGGSLF